MMPLSSTLGNVLLIMVTLGLMRTLLPASKTRFMANAAGIFCGDRGDGCPAFVPVDGQPQSPPRHGQHHRFVNVTAAAATGDRPSSECESVDSSVLGAMSRWGVRFLLSIGFKHKSSLDLDFVGSNCNQFPTTAKKRRHSDHPVGAPDGSYINSSSSVSVSRDVIPSSKPKNRRELSSSYRHKVLPRKKNVVPATTIAAAAAVFFALLCSLAGLLLWCTSKKSKEEAPIRHVDLCPSEPRRYSHCELAAATCGFAEEERIGRGGFGPVYRGYLRDQDCQVAIKVLSQESSVQGMKEFAAEVKVMTRLRHRNIIRLIGWCYGPRDLLLVYEFMQNGSLDKALYDPRRLLTWSERYRIALGLGSAILYLHTNCEQCVVHGDIKPANIMLDSSWNAKLGDFGLARLVDHGTDSRTTQVVAGTVGYIDPEFVSSRRPSTESDVYSFGVVLLETACGKRPNTRQPKGTLLLLDWVREMYRKDLIVGVADRRMDGEFDQQQMKKLLVTGLWCTHHDQSQRPSIAQAMDVLLRRDADLPALPAIMHTPGSVRSLEEIAYGDLGDSDFVYSSADTAYHTSKDSTSLVEC